MREKGLRAYICRNIVRLCGCWTGGAVVSSTSPKISYRKLINDFQAETV